MSAGFAPNESALNKARVRLSTGEQLDWPHGWWVAPRAILEWLSLLVCRSWELVEEELDDDRLYEEVRIQLSGR